MLLGKNDGSFKLMLKRSPRTSGQSVGSHPLKDPEVDVHNVAARPTCQSIFPSSRGEHEGFLQMHCLQ